ncbi:unnamed protein product, partial [Discosporangium mesarthrocarpum]
SHRLHGVDNTGNVAVWPSEQVLLHYVLSGDGGGGGGEGGTTLPPALDGARVLELGAGMAGLAGLGIAACSSAREVVVTDGNPGCVSNL